MHPTRTHVIASRIAVPESGSAPLESGQGGRGTEGETGQKTAWCAHDRIGATNARVALKWQDLAASLGARQARIQDSGDREDPSERRGARPVATRSVEPGKLGLDGRRERRLAAQCPEPVDPVDDRRMGGEEPL